MVTAMDTMTLRIEPDGTEHVVLLDLYDGDERTPVVIGVGSTVAGAMADARTALLLALGAVDAVLADMAAQRAAWVRACDRPPS